MKFFHFFHPLVIKTVAKEIFPENNFYSHIEDYLFYTDNAQHYGYGYASNPNHFTPHNYPEQSQDFTHVTDILKRKTSP